MNNNYIIKFNKITHDFNVIKILLFFVNEIDYKNKGLYVNRVYNDYLNNILNIDYDNTILMNYINNDSFTLEHYIDELNDDLIPLFSPSLVFYLNNLKTVETKELINLFENIDFNNSPLNDVINNEITSSKSFLENTFLKINQEITFHVEEKDLKYYQPIILNKDFSFSNLNYKDSLNIVYIMISSLKHLDKDLFLKEAIILKKLYIMLLVGETLCLMK